MSISFSRHEIYPDKILIRTFSGIVSSTHILESWEELIHQNLLTPNCIGIINDLTKCELNMNMCSFSKIISFLKENKEFKHLRLAVVTDSPKVIVFPMLMEENEKTLSVKPFSTFSAAEAWILDSE